MHGSHGSRISRIASIVATILVLVAGTTARAQVIDRVLAVVDSSIITLSDTLAALRLGLITVPPSSNPIVPAVDVLIDRELVETFRGPRVVDGEHVHGTGCMMSTAIATHLALGASLVEAIRAAKEMVAARIASPVRPGRGAAAVL